MDIPIKYIKNVLEFKGLESWFQQLVDLGMHIFTSLEQRLLH